MFEVLGATIFGDHENLKSYQLIDPLGSLILGLEKPNSRLQDPSASPPLRSKV
ncbi:hypothetical protein NUITMVRA1_19430 [Aerococcus viridans]|nr:hypothetical protein NUITMVRA1_19430 [Aerococcus viridans]